MSKSKLTPYLNLDHYFIFVLLGVKEGLDKMKGCLDRSDGSYFGLKNCPNRAKREEMVLKTYAVIVYIRG